MVSTKSWFRAIGRPQDQQVAILRVAGLPGISLSRNLGRSTVVRTENAPAEIADRVAALNIVNLRGVDSETIDRSGMSNYAARMTFPQKTTGARAYWLHRLWIPPE